MYICGTIMNILSYITALFILFHPLHISVTEITFDEKEKELEIVSRIFLDDLQTAIRESKKLPELDLLAPTGGMTTDQLVSAYLMQRLKLSIKGKPLTVKYLGHEIESEAILCYVQVSNIRKLESIEIFNSIITELHEDQSNLVHVTVREKVKSLRLMKDNPSGTLTFESR
jgi:hypothetical protein